MLRMRIAPQIYELFMSDLGRLLFPQGHCDAGKYMLSCTGATNSGKEIQHVYSLQYSLL